MRAVSAAAVIVAVAISYLAFRRLTGKRSALAVSAIVAVSPVLVSYSFDARSYGLFVLTALLSIWGVAEVLDRATSWSFAFWAATSTACIWTHYFGVFLVAGEAAILLVTLPNARWKLMGWSLVIVACVAPLLPMVLHQSGDERAVFIAGIPLRSRFTSTLRQFGMGPNVPRSWLEAAGLLILWSSAVAGAIYALRARDRRVLVVTLALIAAGVPLLMAVIRIDDVFYARNVIAAAPLLVAVAAPAMVRFRAVPLAAYLVVAAVTSLWVSTDWRYEQLDWRAALNRTQAIQPAAPVIAITKLDGPVIRTYLRRQPAPPSGTATERAWVVVPPLRTAGHRELSPAPAPALKGFTTLRTLNVHGFTLLLMGAAQRTTVTSADVPGSVVFPGSR